MILAAVSRYLIVSPLCFCVVFFLFPAGVLVCKTVPFVQTTAIVTGILTMTCIAIERYQGIVFPLKMRRQYSSKRAYKMLGIPRMKEWLVFLCVDEFEGLFVAFLLSVTHAKLTACFCEIQLKLELNLNASADREGCYGQQSAERGEHAF